MKGPEGEVSYGDKRCRGSYWNHPFMHLGIFQRVCLTQMEPLFKGSQDQPVSWDFGTMMTWISQIYLCHVVEILICEQSLGVEVEKRKCATGTAATFQFENYKILFFKVLFFFSVKPIPHDVNQVQMPHVFRGKNLEKCWWLWQTARKSLWRSSFQHCHGSSTGSWSCTLFDHRTWI